MTSLERLNHLISLGDFPIPDYFDYEKINFYQLKNQFWMIIEDRKRLTFFIKEHQIEDLINNKIKIEDLDQLNLGNLYHLAEDPMVFKIIYRKVNTSTSQYIKINLFVRFDDDTSREIKTSHISR